MRNIRKVSNDDYKEIRNILEQHLTKEDAERNIETLPNQTVFVYTENNKIVGFLSHTKKKEREPLDEAVFNGYKIVPIQDYAILQSGYVEKDRTGNGIGRNLGIYTLKKLLKENIKLFYTETWIKPEQKDSSNLLEKYTEAEKIRETEEHFIQWKQEASEKELKRTCPGCKRKNKNCKCKGAIYRIQIKNKNIPVEK
jgi:GNAT superfamily N-acetyltransferase